MARFFRQGKSTYTDRFVKVEGTRIYIWAVNHAVQVFDELPEGTPRPAVRRMDLYFEGEEAGFWAKFNSERQNVKIRPPQPASS